MAVAWKKVAFTTDVILNTLIDAKGDLIVGSGADAVTRLPIGTANWILAVNVDTPGWINPTSLAVALHESTHKNGGSDEILLHEFGEPTAAVAFDGQQATNIVAHNVADSTARLALTPVLGKYAFQVDELALYVCTSIA